MTDPAPWHKAPGHLRSPNIAGDPEVYEIENLAADPDGVIEAAMQRIAPWHGKVVVDIGAGTGFHVERFHADAAHVIAVEPEPALRLRLMHRLVDRQLARTSVVGASAAAIPLRDNSVDIVHARFAYFFGPGCEPGISEVERILKPGGTAFIIDNDLTAGTFARWIHAAYGRSPKHGAAIEDFWCQKGFTVDRLTSCWRFDCREDFEWVVRLEFPAEHARRFVADHSGLEVDYNVLLIHRTY